MLQANPATESTPEAEPGGQNKSSEWINGAEPSSFDASEDAARFSQDASKMSESLRTKHNIIW